LAGDAALREELGRVGRARAECFDWPRIAGQYLEIYRSLLPGGGAR
jgi:glycosyltransferase involved in cell wall biosynthesis